MTKHIAVPDLKPCPFCGGEATVMEAVGDVWVKCCVCHSSNGVSTGDRKKAIDAWNARALLNGPGVEPVAWIHPMDLGRFPTVHFEKLNDELVGLYLAAPSAPVPDGWQLVPKKETPAMHDAVMSYLCGGVSRLETQRLLDAYLAAAPQPSKEIGE